MPECKDKTSNVPDPKKTPKSAQMVAAPLRANLMIAQLQVKVDSVLDNLSYAQLYALLRHGGLRFDNSHPGPFHTMYFGGNRQAYDTWLGDWETRKSGLMLATQDPGVVFIDQCGSREHANQVAGDFRGSEEAGDSWRCFAFRGGKANVVAVVKVLKGYEPPALPDPNTWKTEKDAKMAMEKSIQDMAAWQTRITK
jgi:hypothetical protein